MFGQRILALSPHPDDVELGCGGTIARLAREKRNVYIRVFSWCEESTPDEGAILRGEWLRSMSRLGTAFSTKNVQSGLPVRTLPSLRQHVLEELLAMKRELKPDTVLVPATTDRHQDHMTVTAEAQRAFKDCTLLGYHLPWNETTTHNNLFVRLTADDINTKEDALSCYASQAHRPYFKHSVTDSAAQVAGVQCGVDWAEAFEVIRVVL